LRCENAVRRPEQYLVILGGPYTLHYAGASQENEMPKASRGSP